MEAYSASDQVITPCQTIISSIFMVFYVTLFCSALRSSTVSSAIQMSYCDDDDDET